MSPEIKDLCIKVCSLRHTCIMEEHPDRPDCTAAPGDEGGCDTVRMISIAAEHLAPALQAAEDAIVNQMHGIWSKEDAAKALMLIIPHVLARER